MEKSENSNYGKVTQVIGSTLDAHFSEDQLPRIYNALRVEVKRIILGKEHEETLWCEVAQHLGGGRVRAVALGSTDGLTRGADILDTGRPIAGAAGSGRAVDYEFSPGPRELLDELLPAIIRARLFQAFNDALVSEQVARMVAMKAATDAAGDMIKALSRQYNRARQTQITMELLDIVGGSNALS